MFMHISEAERLLSSSSSSFVNISEINRDMNSYRFHRKCFKHLNIIQSRYRNGATRRQSYTLSTELHTLRVRLKYQINRNATKTMYRACSTFLFKSFTIVSMTPIFYYSNDYIIMTSFNRALSLLICHQPYQVW